MRVFWVYGLLVAAGVVWNIHLPVGTLILTLTFGLLLWTPLEYVLHRYVFHRLAPHYQHHDFPTELQYIFAPLWFSGVAAVVLFGLFGLAAGSWQRGALIDAGVISGYLCYEALHVWIHSPRAGRARPDRAAAAPLLPPLRGRHEMLRRGDAVLGPYLSHSSGGRQVAVYWPQSGGCMKLSACFAAALCCGILTAQPRIDPDDIGGVVTGPKGPEAGVWVIAETTDLPTRYIKIVVTDDRGRYVLPDLPKANYSVWVRGYGLVDSPEGAGRAGQGVEPDSGARARRQGGGGILSGELLVFAAEGAGQERVSGHRPAGQRDRRQHQEPGASGWSS